MLIPMKNKGEDIESYGNIKIEDIESYEKQRRGRCDGSLLVGLLWRLDI